MQRTWKEPWMTMNEAAPEPATRSRIGAQADTRLPPTGPEGQGRTALRAVNPCP